MKRHNIKIDGNNIVVEPAIESLSVEFQDHWIIKLPGDTSHFYDIDNAALAVRLSVESIENAEDEKRELDAMWAEAADEDDVTLEELDAAGEAFDQWKANKKIVENPLDEHGDNYEWIVGSDYEFHDELAFVTNEDLSRRVHACAIVKYRELYDAGKIKGEYNEDGYIAGIEPYLAYVSAMLRTIRDKATLNLVVTASDVATKYGLSESAVRQYLNRHNPYWAKKSAGTWLVLAEVADSIWGKK